MLFTTPTFIICFATFFHSCIAGYALVDDYSGANFFDKFSFFTQPDPTNGFVQYVDQATAQSSGLISQDGQSVKMGVDSTNSAPNGRSSVRITSNKIYNHGLIILDAAHMPVGCGTWPAFWTVGPSWPVNGEIDIIEGVNNQAFNAMTLHTGPSCSIENNGLFKGNIITPNCDVNAYGQANNAGCSIDASDSKTYGAGFNAVNGGVYAMQWTSEAISIYFFPRSEIPSDISSGKPDPSSWGNAYATFQGGCDLDTNFKDQQIVFDTTFCGDWAGGAWGSDSTCSAKSWSCEDYVANNPSAFADAFWKINSLKVYQTNGDSSSGQAVQHTNAGPYGVAPTLPPVISSDAPIPWTSQDVATTFVVSTTPSPVWSAPTTPVDTWTTPSPTTWWGESSSSYVPSSTPVWAESAAGFAAAPAPTTSWESTTDYAAAWTPTPTPVPSAAVVPTPVSSAAVLQASWFPDGGASGGIPASAVPQIRRHARHIMAHKHSAQRRGNALAFDGPNGNVHVHHHHARRANLFGLI